MDPDSSFKSYSHRIKTQATLLVFLQLQCASFLCVLASFPGATIKYPDRSK